MRLQNHKCNNNKYTVSTQSQQALRYFISKWRNTNVQENVLLPSTSRSAASSLAALVGARAVCRPVGGPTYCLRLMKRVCLRQVKRWPVRGHSTRVKQRRESWESLAVPRCPVSWLWGSELCVCKGCVLATRAAQFKWNGKKKWKLYAPSSMTDWLG